APEVHSVTAITALVCHLVWENDGVDLLASECWNKGVDLANFDETLQLYNYLGDVLQLRDSLCVARAHRYLNATNGFLQKTWTYRVPTLAPMFSYHAIKLLLDIGCTDTPAGQYVRVRTRVYLVFACVVARWSL